MTRKGQSITLSINDQDKAQLETIALEHGMTWGDEPNISRLVKAIAQRQLLIGRNNDWSSDRVQSLRQAVNLLIDTGKLDEARTVIRLLLERSELPIPMRSELEQRLQQSIVPWRQQIEQYIRQHQPFQLSYQDAAQQLLTFTVRFARIVPREKREYLECWCEEEVENADIPELQHNWTFRLDRISEAAFVPAAGKWRSHLDTVTVELHLSGGLAFNYQPRPEDQINEWLSDRPHTRRVLRHVSSTFWLFREILPYGEDCLIVSPQGVRDRLVEKLRQMVEAYQNADSNAE